MTAQEKKTTAGYIIIAVFTLLTLFLVWLDKKKPIENSPNAVSLHIDNMDKEEKAKNYPAAIEIVNPSGFINTDGITIEENIGKKVVLIDFWTFSCINCQRTLPYLRDWYDKYKDQGLEIIGVHTPEFEFEKDIKNVQEAVDKWQIKYPVVLDNDYATWNAYKNKYWPRKYIIDIDGFIVYDHIGEGGYEETEMKIQALLAERATRLNEDAEAVKKEIEKPKDAEDVNLRASRSPETYFGALRNTGLANGRATVTGLQTFTLPSKLAADKLYLEGSWDIRQEYASNLQKNTKIVFKYNAQKVFLVASGDYPVKAKVLIDGKPLGSNRGRDVDEDSYVTFQNEELYRLVEDTKQGEHTLEIIFEDIGAKVFAFTFG